MGVDRASIQQFNPIGFWIVVGIAIILNSRELFVTTIAGRVMDGMEPVFGWPWTIVSRGGMGFHTEFSLFAMLLDGALALAAANFVGHITYRLMHRKYAADITPRANPSPSP
jgi:hypothetical protein